MAISWSDYRDQIRRVQLNDDELNEEGKYRWSDLELRDCCWWALDIFAQHTAAATATSYTTVGQEFPLPDNFYTGERIEVAGEIFITSPALPSPKFLDPINYTDGLNPFTGAGFYAYPDTVLHLTKALEQGSTLNVRYFAYYNHPYSDSDTIDIPQWALLPVAYLIAAHVVSGNALKSAGVRQWGAKPDTGTPEHNPLQRQVESFLRLYEMELSRYSPQNRARNFRNLKRQS